MYEDFHILIDDPAPTLSLGFDDYAGALTEIASVSRPQFAIGIFGTWGAGKTTLMRAMEQAMVRHDDVIPVWFNAWRYEKEEHLIIPLLDTLREEVVAWSAAEQPEDPVRDQATKLAGVLGRAARAILSGLSLKAGIPAVVEASLDANKILAEWRNASGNEQAAAIEPKSFYHAAFLALRSSVWDFLRSGDGQPGGGLRRRFVVFVDDLDRCLPEKALEVLESMKLFFDLEGFVFVVGLDQRIIERAVQLKYPTQGKDGSGETATYISGADYVKKIFQVQFTAPRVDQSQLTAYLDAIATAGGLPPSQRADLQEHVVPQIANLVGSSSVNPREVKRLINAYTMQMKILERKLRDSHRTPSAAAVLALQIMSFRADWEPAYNLLSNNPADFVDAVVQTLSRGGSVIAVDQEVIELPPSLLSYLREEGSAVLAQLDLDVYVSALESARTTDPRVREIAQQLGQLRVALRAATPTDSGDVRELLNGLAARLSAQSDSGAAIDASQRLRQLMTSYPGADPADASSDTQERRASWLQQVGAQLVLVGETVADLRRRATTTTASAA